MGRHAPVQHRDVGPNVAIGVWNLVSVIRGARGNSGQHACHWRVDPLGVYRTGGENGQKNSRKNGHRFTNAGGFVQHRPSTEPRRRGFARNTRYRRRYLSAVSWVGPPQGHALSELWWDGQDRRGHWGSLIALSRHWPNCPVPCREHHPSLTVSCSKLHEKWGILAARHVQSRSRQAQWCRAAVDQGEKTSWSAAYPSPR